MHNRSYTRNHMTQFDFLYAPRGTTDWRLIAQSSSKREGRRLLPIVFLNDLDRRAHVAGDFKNADTIPQSVYGVKVPQAINRILLAEAAPLDPCFFERSIKLIDECANL